MKYPSLLVLPFLALFTGCSNAKIVGTSSSRIVSRTSLVDSRIVGSLPSEGLPQLPDNPEGTAWTLGGRLDLPERPSMLEQKRLKDKNISLDPLPSGSVELRAYPGQRWMIGLGAQANPDGPSSFWLGVGRSFPVSGAVGAIRVGAGLHHMNSTNTYEFSQTATDCDEMGRCLTDIARKTYQEDNGDWAPFGRFILSLQPRQSGPWLDLQATTNLVVADWPGTRSTTVKTTRYSREDCGIFSTCDSDSTWTESTDESSDGGRKYERIEALSTGAGWTIRQGNQQWTAGARWYPLVGTVQASMQWSISFAGAGASR